MQQNELNSDDIKCYGHISFNVFSCCFLSKVWGLLLQNNAMNHLKLVSFRCRKLNVNKKKTICCLQDTVHQFYVVIVRTPKSYPEFIRGTSNEYSQHTFLWRKIRKYSRPSISRPCLSRITSYLEVNIRSLF